MNGPENFLAAEELLAVANTYDQDGAPVTGKARRDEALVRAVLALAAATALNDHNSENGGMPLDDYHAWALAAGVWKPKPKGAAPQQTIRDSRSSAALTVFRAEDGKRLLGHYTTRDAAREHCKTRARVGWPEGQMFQFAWNSQDEDNPWSPERLTTYCEQNGERVTGYVVTPVPVAVSPSEEATA